MSKKIQAITTYYNGYKFRSRLEARWAVFFDAMGITYEYEPEGFKTPYGNYLPDFYLPQLRAWMEVKGGREWTPDERAKLTSVCSSTDCVGLFVYGDPLDQFKMPKNKTIMLYSQLGISSTKTVYRKTARFIFGRHKHENIPTITPLIDESKCGEYGPIFNAIDKCGDYAKSGIIYTNTSWVPLSMAKNVDFKLSKRSAKKARQARFEHGETPKC